MVAGDHMSTRDQIRRLIEFSPTLGNAEIARVLGCSRQNVSYHARRLALPREGVPRSCAGGCGRRVRQGLTTGMCRSCWRISHSYEFVCAACGQVRAVSGDQAASRRRNAKHLKGEQARDYCDSSCAARHNQRKFWAVRRLDPGTARHI